MRREVSEAFDPDPSDWEPVRDPTDPPSGWYRFGTHAGWDPGEVPVLEFSEVADEQGFPLWERPFAHRYLTEHDDATEAVNRIWSWVQFDRENRPDRDDDEPLGISYISHPVTRRDLATLVNVHRT